MTSAPRRPAPRRPARVRLVSRPRVPGIKAQAIDGSLIAQNVRIRLVLPGPRAKGFLNAGVQHPGGHMHGAFDSTVVRFGQRHNVVDVVGAHHHARHQRLVGPHHRHRRRQMRRGYRKVVGGRQDTHTRKYPVFGAHKTLFQTQLFELDSAAVDQLPLPLVDVATCTEVFL